MKRYDEYAFVCERYDEYAFFCVRKDTGEACVQGKVCEKIR